MKKFYRLFTQIFIMTIILVAAMNSHAGSSVSVGVQPVAGPNYNPGVIPPQNKTEGKTYGEWGAEWFNWALSVPYDHNPILDITGIDGSQNQKGPIWFLAGTFGTPAERTITIPADKFIFFPLVNTENDYPCPDPNFQPPPGQTLEDFLTSISASQIDPWAGPDHTLSATVDGVELTHLLNYRGTSKLTKLKADVSNLPLDPCLIERGGGQPMVSDGYWIMLAPLKPGKHEITFSAFSPIEPPLPFNLKVIYHVTISQ